MSRSAAPQSTPANAMRMQFHLLAFEGPDPYARAGGIASRITGLAHALAAAGFDTHLWFVGDPDLPGHEMHDRIQLHRWCQWLSRFHPAGVYDGEEAKQTDYAASLPPFLLQEMLLPHLGKGGQAVILAEEWHTVHTVLHLDWLLRQAHVRSQVTILWNANNTFGSWPLFVQAHLSRTDGDLVHAQRAENMPQAGFSSEEEMALMLRLPHYFLPRQALSLQHA